MSHFTTIKTKFTDQGTLVESLKELGYNQTQVGQFQCRGYQGNQTTVDILIKLQGGYDIGFVNRNNSFEMIADWYGIHGISQKIWKFNKIVFWFRCFFSNVRCNNYLLQAFRHIDSPN